LKDEDRVAVKVDFTHRLLVVKNNCIVLHTLRLARCQVLGDKIYPKGLLLDECMRHIDSSYPRLIEEYERRKIEEICNHEIQKAYAFHFSEVVLEMAGPSTDNLSKFVLPLKKSVTRGVRRVVDMGPQAVVGAVLRSRAWSTKVDEVKLISGVSLDKKTAGLRRTVGEGKEVTS
jgi:alanyl-tRNA synthetase